MRYLLFIKLFFLSACSSQYKGLVTASGDINCVQKFQPVFASALYNTKVNVIGKHLSGLLLIKTMPDSSIRMVFSNEMGFKFFDFGFAANGTFTVYSIIKQMNKRAVVNTLQKDFELVMMRHLDTATASVKREGELFYYSFRQDKEVNYYITGSGCSELVRIEKASRRKTKVQVVMRHYVQGIPDTIGITHKNFNFNIGLKKAGTMMLKDDFFKIIQIDTEVASVKAVLELNPGHSIFKGHFPGTPVVPGVCMMQMVKEIVEMHVGATVLLSKADSMKFLSVIDPRVNSVVEIALSFKTTEEAVDVNASLSSGETVCFKFKGKFVVVVPNGP